jgi:aspartate/methionine/tyrosine aminotransferase
MVREFDRRRQLVYKRLNEIDGIECLLPKGAFYAFPNISSFGLSSEQFADHLVKEANVLVVPGSVFGKGGENHVRFSYAASYDRLEEALDRIQESIKKFG